MSGAKIVEEPSSVKQFQMPHALSVLLATRRRAEALRFLDGIIGSDFGIFREDPRVIRQRQGALHFKINLLLEWDRRSEALAWLCLETEINPENVYAQAMKKRLLATLCMGDLRTNQVPVRGRPATDRKIIEWEGVAGMRELKLTLENDIILPFMEPDLYKQYRVPILNGVLFYGPPGCGKTFVARKLADIIKFNFMELKPSDLASIYVHGTQEKIGTTFRRAEEQRPAILFFDEIEAFIPSREAEVGHHYSAEVNEFLAEMNDCAGRGILIIGATNYLDRVDVSARRPGRFDKKIYVGPPDLEARIEAVKLYMKGRPQEAIDYCALLDGKELYSYADLELVVNEAAREALKTQDSIGERHLKMAFTHTAPSITTQMIEKSDVSWI